MRFDLRLSPGNATYVDEGGKSVCQACLPTRAGIGTEHYHVVSVFSFLLRASMRRDPEQRDAEQYERDKYSPAHVEPSPLVLIGEKHTVCRKLATFA